MKLLNLLFGSIIFFSSSEDVFFRNIKEKPRQQQSILLQKRIKKDSISPHRITTRESVMRYLEVDTTEVEKFRFVNSTITNSTQETFKSEAIEGLLNYCQTRLTLCMPHILQYLDCKSAAKCLVSSANAQILFSPENLDVIIKNKAIFLKLLDYSGPDLELAKTLYRHAVNFGFLESAEKLLKLHVAAEADPVIKQYKCTYYFLKKEYELATECSVEAKDQWAKLITGYVIILKKQKLNEKEYELLLQDLMNSPLARPRYFAIAMSGILLKKMASVVPDYDVDGIAKDYWNGYMLLASNKKHHFLKSDFQKKLEEKFAANFPNSLLLRIYTGAESNDILKQSLGENSFLYQASI